jgi:hypothetical protein
MFLDDELLKLTKEANINTPEDIQVLNTKLCHKCEDFYKKKLISDINGQTKTQMLVILNKTFNFWDSFVRMLKTDGDKELNILAILFERYSFKYQFLKNKEMLKVYKELGGVM